MYEILVGIHRRLKLNDLIENNMIKEKNSILGILEDGVSANHQRNTSKQVNTTTKVKHHNLLNNVESSVFHNDFDCIFKEYIEKINLE